MMDSYYCKFLCDVCNSRGEALSLEARILSQDNLPDVAKRFLDGGDSGPEYWEWVLTQCANDLPQATPEAIQHVAANRLS